MISPSDDNNMLSSLLISPDSPQQGNESRYRSIIHEGEYVSIPSRTPLPISTTENSYSGSFRIDSPSFFHNNFANDQKLPSSYSPSPIPLQEPADNAPTLIHKWSHTHSILCVVLAPSKKLVFCGTQDSKILVYDIENYNLKFVINTSPKEYSASILCLTISEDESFLFSAGSDSLVKVWNLSSLTNLSSINIIHCTHIIYSLVDIGDVFSISWSDSLSTLFIGAQNASILWCQLSLLNDCPHHPAPHQFVVPDQPHNISHSTPNLETSSQSVCSNESCRSHNESGLDNFASPSTIERLPHFRFDKFFDSKGPGGSFNRLQSQHQLLKSKTSQEKGPKYGTSLIEVNPDDIIRFAHNGYVYCMEILSTANKADLNASSTSASNKANDFIELYGNDYNELLISCGGDGIVNIWGINNQLGPDQNEIFEIEHDKNDKPSKQKSKSTSKISIERLTSLENDESILSMSIQDSYLYVGLSNSTINVWDLMTFQLIRSFHFVNESSENADITPVTSSSSNVDKSHVHSMNGSGSTTSSSNDEILSLGIFNDCIFKASNLGGLIKFTLKNYQQINSVDVNQFEEKGNNNYKNFKNDNLTQDFQLSHIVSAEDEKYNKLFFKSHNSVLAIQIFNMNSRTYLVSGGLKSLCLWDISDVGVSKKSSKKNSITGINEPGLRANNNQSLPSVFENHNIGNDDLLKSLKKFISYKTILKYPTLYLEDSRHCAQFLSKLLISLGAKQTKLLAVDNANPVVYSLFTKNSPAKSPNEKVTRVLWYAHYDVVEVNTNEPWQSEPFHLTATDGNLYARGVSDNKGPTLAAIYAVSELYRNRELSCDVVFIVEGEEECGSIGFQNVIQENKPLIGDIDWVMLSNSYWLDDDTPCLNYGLRGVINASVSVTSDKPDRHSGVDGGVSKEPTMDLIQILSELIDRKTNKINIPNFYDDVLPLTKTEIEIYKKIEDAACHKSNGQDLKSLMAKWRNPSLTVHKIQVSGPNNNSVIPQSAKASISIRVVPNQDLVKIKKSLISFLSDQFGQLNSDNEFGINIFHEAEPWLGDPSNLVYKILYDKIKLNWSTAEHEVEPFYIREGGSIPSIRFLEKCFNAPAAQIPCGQASDNAHLTNEKLRIINLYKLRAILTDTLRELGQ